MKILIIYDSYYGNTEKIARAISNALSSKENIEIFKADAIKPEQLKGVNVLIVGSPTRAFRPSPVIKNLLKNIAKNSLQGVKIAAFDTRIALEEVKSPIFRFIIKTGGFAAPFIANKLKKKGGDLIMPPEAFFIKGTQGSLKEGELDRAIEWAKRINTTW